MFVVTLLSEMGKDGRVNPTTELVILLAFRESGTAGRDSSSLMRWSVGELPGNQKGYKLSTSAEPLLGGRRSREGPGPSY